MVLAGSMTPMRPEDIRKQHQNKNYVKKPDQKKSLRELQNLLSDFQLNYDRMVKNTKHKRWSQQLRTSKGQNTQPINDIPQADKDAYRRAFIRKKAKSLKRLRAEIGNTPFNSTIVDYFLRKPAEQKNPRGESQQSPIKSRKEKVAFGRWVLAGVSQHQKEQAQIEAQRMAESGGKTKPKSQSQPDQQALAQESERKLIVAAKSYAVNLSDLAKDTVGAIERLANYILHLSKKDGDWRRYAINLGLMRPHEEKKQRQDVVNQATQQYHELYGLLAADLVNRQPLRKDLVREIFALVKPGILANREKIPYAFYLAMRLHYPDQTPDFENMPAQEFPKKPPRVKTVKPPRALRKQSVPEIPPATPPQVTAKREREPGKRSRPGSAKHQKKKYGPKKVDLDDPNNDTNYPTENGVLVHASPAVAVAIKPDHPLKLFNVDSSPPTGTPTHNLEWVSVGSKWADISGYVQEISVTLCGLKKELEKSTVEADRKFATLKIKSLVGAITTVERTVGIKLDTATANVAGLEYNQFSPTYRPSVSAFFVTCQKAAAAISSFQQDHADHTGLQDVISVLFGPKDANENYVDKVTNLANRLQNTR
jgi:hypothetical protein